jgi:hypothetical protein
MKKSPKRKTPEPISVDRNGQAWLGGPGDPEPLNLSIREIVARLMSQRGWTMAQLASESGVGKASVGKYLSRKIDVGSASADLLLRALRS